MRQFKNRQVVAIGEAMIEMASVPGGLYARSFAGDCFNTAWHMAQILGPAAEVNFCTRIGSDAFSDAFAAELAQDGLGTACLQRDATRSMGLYLIALTGAERSFHYWRGQSAARGLADDAAALSAALQGAGLIHFSGITLAILSEAARGHLLGALAEARRAGAVISFDPNVRPRLWASLDEARSASRPVLALADIVLPSFDDEALMWGDASPEATRARLCAAGVGEVVVKNGPQPVCFHADGEDGTCATPGVATLRDTTGAGDAFNAGYLEARLMGQGAEAAIATGQALSGEVIQHFGARAPKDRLAVHARRAQAGPSAANM